MVEGKCRAFRRGMQFGKMVEGKSPPPAKANPYLRALRGSAAGAVRGATCKGLPKAVAKPRHPVYYRGASASSSGELPHDELPTDEYGHTEVKDELPMDELPTDEHGLAEVTNELPKDVLPPDGEADVGGDDETAVGGDASRFPDNDPTETDEPLETVWDPWFELGPRSATVHSGAKVTVAPPLPFALHPIVRPPA